MLSLLCSSVSSVVQLLFHPQLVWNGTFATLRPRRSTALPDHAPLTEIPRTMRRPRTSTRLRTRLALLALLCVASTHSPLAQPASHGTLYATRRLAVLERLGSRLLVPSRES